MSALRVTNKLWLISDTHFGHKNIVKFQQRPESHHELMLSEWIWRVQPNDQILHLGDVFMGKSGNPARWAAILSRLPGEKFLILGNHDKQKTSLYAQASFTVVKPFVHLGHAFTHRPVSYLFPVDAPESRAQAEARLKYLQTPGVTFPDPGKGWHTNIHGHIHGNTIAQSEGYEGGEGGFYIPGKTYINVCVEVTDFAPVQLGNVWGEGKQGRRCRT